jgi:hypothetical protein
MADDTTIQRAVDALASHPLAGHPFPDGTARKHLQGNAFITIPKGTVVTTDDPLFPRVILLEDVKVCSNAKAKVMEAL